MAMIDRREIGLVSSCYGRELSVFYKKDKIRAIIKGKLLEESSRHNIVSGDYCILEKNKNRYMVTGRLERQTELIRFLEKRDRTVKNQVIAANCDQILAVFSLVEPNINPYYLDLLLCHSLYTGIHPVIVFNKMDITDLSQFKDILQSYTHAGFEIILTSVKENINIEKIKELLRGNKTVLAGPSGSGKSSLLKAINPDLNLRIGALTKDKKGSHSTSTSIVYELFDDTYIYDTPGFGKLFHKNIDYDIIKAGYPEFFNEKIKCGFRDCRHIEEKECIVKDSVLNDAISNNRYKRYYIFSRDKDPLHNLSLGDVRESILADTGLFMVQKTAFNVFDCERALKYHTFISGIKDPKWFHYVPFIYFSGLSMNRKIILKEIKGLEQVFLWKMKDNRESLSLLFPNPLSGQDDILELILFLRSMNYNRQSNISFLTDEDTDKIKEITGCNKIDNDIGIEIESIGREYIYEKEKVLSMRGKYYRGLKKKIYRFQKTYGELIIRQFQTGDSIAIKNLYLRWLANQSAKYPDIYDSYYTQNAINRPDDLLRLNVEILIAELDRRVIGFIMGGKINDQYSNAFIMKTDNDIKGISYYLKYKFIESAETDYINDGIDFGFYGLKQSKRIFNPVYFPRVYRCRIN